MRTRCIEPLEKRRLFSTLVLTGTTGSNTFFVRKDADGLHLDAWINSATPGTGTPTSSTLISSISSVSLATNAVNNVVTLDFSDGNPLPATASIPGGSGVSNSLIVQGLAGSPVSVNGSSVIVDSTPISYTTLQAITIDGSSANDTLTQTGQPAAPLVFNGGGGNDTLNINAGTYTLVGDPAAATTNLTVNDTGSLFFTADAAGAQINARHLAALNIGSGGTVIADSPPDAADRAVLVFSSLSINGTGLLDLTGNDMIVHNGSLPALSADVAKGYNLTGGANWKGLAGITSSLAAVDTSHESAVGVILNNNSGSTIYNSTNQFDGQPAVLTDVLVKFTVFGDANLDGKVDGSDYTLIDSGYGRHLTGWFNGDFNYDGVVDGSDYTLVDNTYNTPSTALSPLTYQLETGLDVAQEQSQKTIASLGTPGTLYPQYVLPNGTWSTVSDTHWTTGTWAGELWDLYAATGNPYYKTEATAFTTPLSINDTATSDSGPHIYDAFYPLLQTNPNATTTAMIVQTMLTAAASKSSVYNSTVGAFEAWRTSESRNPAANFNVLLDLIMDSQLLFWAAKQSGNQTYYNEAVQNALTEAQYNVHADGSTTQFVYFNSSNGSFVDDETYQGYSNTSVWSRGQAWAIYGFNQVYQDTGNTKFLATSESAANWFISHLPSDDIPYWDFNAPVTSTTYRDTSAAAIAASGLLQLSKSIATSDPVNSAKYRNAAGSILSSLVSSTYLANPAAPGDGTIQHGALNVPASPSIPDNPIVFGDYYFIEAVNEYLAG